MFTNETILDLLKQDTEKGSAMLVAQYSSLLSSICADKLQNEEDIKECVNDTFADFLLNYKSYDSSKGSLKNYLCTIAKHKSIDKYRQNLHQAELNKELIEKYKEEQHFTSECPDEMVQLENAMEKLPLLEQQILQMHYYDDKSYKEISDELGMNYEKVRKRGLRGKKKLLYILLIGLLILSITACTTIVMKKHGLLPTWFPFYDMIPDISPENDDEQNEEEAETTDEFTTSQIDQLDSDLEELGETETDETSAELPTTNETTKEETEQEGKKYQVSSNKGLIWSDSPVYEMGSDTQAYTKDDVTYELQSAFYQDGEWELSFLISCSDEERTRTKNFYSTATSEEIIAELERLNQKINWIEEEKIFLNDAYLQSENGQKIPLIYADYGKATDFPSNTAYICTYTCKWSLENMKKNMFTIMLVFPDGNKFEITMKKLDVKDYVEPSDNSEENVTESELIHSDIITLTPGIAEFKNGMAVITLNQENIQEYQIADLITQGYYGLINREAAKIYLTAEDGTQRERMRVTKQTSETENGKRNTFEIYFRDIEPGKYSLEFSNICLQKDMTTESVTLPLPTGEEDYLECNLMASFADGTGIYITGVERYEEIEKIYIIDSGVVTCQEQFYWCYNLDYECISIENEPELCLALSKGISSNGIEISNSIVSKNQNLVYRYEVASDEMPEYLTLQFYSPFYILDQKFAFDFVITE